MDRKRIFFIALAYLFIILILGLLFFLRRQWLVFVPSAFGPVAVGVPWFGALGAVLISLTGVFEHEHDWDPGYWPWHLSRPLIGIGLGVVSVLILPAGILAVGSSPASQTDLPKNLLYYLVAFLVGYREETFRELIKRLVDVVLSPGTAKGPAPTVHLANPSQASHGAPTSIVLSGTGLTSTQSVKFGATTAQFKVDSDGQITVTTPTLPAAASVPLTITTKYGSATLQFTFT